MLIARKMATPFPSKHCAQKSPVLLVGPHNSTSSSEKLVCKLIDCVLLLRGLANEVKMQYVIKRLFVLFNSVIPKQCSSQISIVKFAGLHFTSPLKSPAHWHCFPVPSCSMTFFSTNPGGHERKLTLAITCTILFVAVLIFSWLTKSSLLWVLYTVMHGRRQGGAWGG